MDAFNELLIVKSHNNIMLFDKQIIDSKLFYLNTSKIFITKEIMSIFNTSFPKFVS